MFETPRRPSVFLTAIFTAWYGAEGIEPEGLAACTELADGIEGLARERIGAEMKKLLAAPDPAPAVAAMAASGVLMRAGWREPGRDASVEPGRGQDLGQYPRTADHAGSGCHRRPSQRRARGAGNGTAAGREWG